MTAASKGVDAIDNTSQHPSVDDRDNSRKHIVDYIRQLAKIAAKKAGALKTTSASSTVSTTVATAEGTMWIAPVS